jgi:hypothetical protein
MSPFHVLLLASLTWTVSIPASSLQQLAHCKSGSVSVFPVIPIFPLLAWVVALLLDRFMYGALTVGVIHVVLLVALLCSMIKSFFSLRRAAGR